MDEYDEVEIEENELPPLPLPLPFPEEIIGTDFAKIQVKTGSRIFNLVKFALSSLEKNVNLVIIASGPAIAKAVTICEIIKRKQAKVFQWNKIGSKIEKEYSKATKVKMTRKLPTMHIFLTTTPLDASLHGVQAPASERKRRKQSQASQAQTSGTQESRNPKRARRQPESQPINTTAAASSSSGGGTGTATASGSSNS